MLKLPKIHELNALRFSYLFVVEIFDIHAEVKGNELTASTPPVPPNFPK